MTSAESKVYVLDEQPVIVRLDQCLSRGILQVEGNDSTSIIISKRFLI